ncbi:hypothetical protein [uncultured Williamsia sp.]|uniref:hypothetical protein n=1 Tax=uncultured Williamsia sp. TaxID=259311 RepID=UPI0026029681|nr:hypothetical protein [uncultured Williamsia sp.]
MFSEIAVVYPRGLRTGGPEALHQLVDSLRRRGQEAYLVPSDDTVGPDRVAEYAVYDAPERPTLPRGHDSAVVVAETAPAPDRGDAVVFRWWLSIDNHSAENGHIRRLEYGLGMRGEWQEMPRHHRVGTAFKQALRNFSAPPELPPEIDLAQSQYAWAHLFGRTRRPPSMLGDYTPSPDALIAAAVPVARRRRAVCFNPKKSGSLAREVSAGFPDVEFVPIENMSRAEVTRSLGECAVYLDLGSHPGKDRIPREAVLAGAVVVTAMRGSAAFHVDVPIPLHHKVPSDGDVVASARAVLSDVFADLPSAYALQDSYRDVISGEREVFDAQVQAVFTRGMRGFDPSYPIVADMARFADE